MVSRLGVWTCRFAHDGVHLSAEHLPYLMHRARPLHLHQAGAAIPYFSGLRAPFYIYVGRRVVPDGS